MDFMNIGAAALLISILIFIHELGHFLFAKAFGVGVKSFSIGFGRRLFGFEHNGTDYKFCVLPFGGYVLMEGADPFLDDDEMEQEKSSQSSLLVKPVWQRLLIVAAGPFFNLLLPVVLFTGIFMSGEPLPAPVVGQVQHDSLGEKAGVQLDDHIVSVNGEPLTIWYEIWDVLDKAEATQPLELEVLRQGKTQTVVVPPRQGGSFESLSFIELFFGRGLWEWSVSGLGVDPARPSTRVATDDPNSPAAKAGLEYGDRVETVNGVEVADYWALMLALNKSEGPTELGVLRGSTPLTLTMVPDPAYAGVDAQAVFSVSGSKDPMANPWGLYSTMAFIEAVMDDSAASEAGLPPQGRILAIDGKGIGTWAEILRTISDKQIGDSREARSVEISTISDGQLQTQTLTPRIVTVGMSEGRIRPQKVARIGILSGAEWMQGPLARKYYGFGEAVGKSYESTKMLVGLTLGQIGRLFTGEAKPSQTLGGPVQIFRDAGAAAKEGAHTWWRLMAVLSISLAIVNFLPVPVLDGGQFLFFLVEGIRGRPVSLRFRERAQQVGVLLLVTLMLMVLVFDIGRIFGGG